MLLLNIGGYRNINNNCWRRVKTLKESDIVVPTREEKGVEVKLTQYAFDEERHERLHEAYASGELSLRYLDPDRIEHYDSDKVIDLESLGEYRELGEELIEEGALGVVVLKGGAATRLVGGGVDKGIVPMVFLPDGSRESLIALHLMRIKQLKDQLQAMGIPVVLSNSFLNDETTRKYLEEHGYFGLAGDICTAVDVGVGKRLIPRPEDLEEEFRRKEEGMRAWERQVALSQLQAEIEMVKRMVREAEQEGAAYPYDYQPMGMNKNTQLHPLGHFQVLPAMLLGGQIKEMIRRGVKYIMIFNVDNLFNLERMGVDIRPEIVGYMESKDKSVATEFTDRGPDVGGVLAKVQQVDENGNPVYDKNGRPVYRHQILEGVISDPLVEAQKDLDLINTATHYISIDGLLRAFGFDLSQEEKNEIAERVRSENQGLSEEELEKRIKEVEAEARREKFLSLSGEEIRQKVEETLQRVPVYTVIKRVSEMLPDGREYKIPVVQFEQLLGDFPLLLPEEEWQPVYVPRIGPDGRFMPLKELDTLTEIRMREATIEPQGPSPLKDEEGNFDPQKIWEFLNASPIKEEYNVNDIRLFSSLTYNQLLQVVDKINEFIQQNPAQHLKKLKAFMYLYVVFSDYLPDAAVNEGISMRGGVPTEDILKRWGTATCTADFEDIAKDLYTMFRQNPSLTLSWWLAKTYRRLTREARLDQVEESLGAYFDEFLGKLPRSLEEYNARLGGEREGLREKLLNGQAITVRAGCRVELDSIVGSDIFAIAMDYPEGSRVLNAAIYLELEDPIHQKIGAEPGESAPPVTEPPITVVVRTIDEPVIRLTSVDLGQEYDYHTWSSVRDINMDDLGLLKAALLATRIIPREPVWRMENARKYIKDVLGLDMTDEEIDQSLHKETEEIRRDLKEKLQNKGIPEEEAEGLLDGLFKEAGWKYLWDIGGAKEYIRTNLGISEQDLSEQDLERILSFDIQQYIRGKLVEVLVKKGTEEREASAKVETLFNQPFWGAEGARKVLEENGINLSEADVSALIKMNKSAAKQMLSERGLSEEEINRILEIGFDEGNIVGLDEVLEKFFEEKGHGIQVITYVKGIARGSGLAISTSLSAALGAALLQYRGDVNFDGVDLEDDAPGTPVYRDKERVIASALRMEWLGISGGGYQDPAAVWAGVHDIEAQASRNPNSPTRGKLIPEYRTIDLCPEARRLLEESIVIAHLGMAQPVGPMLDIITDSYYLRRAWENRKDSERRYNEQLRILMELNEVAPRAMQGDAQAWEKAMNLLREFGRNMAEDYENRRAISPEATNMYGDRVLEELQRKFTHDLWGWNTTGARAGAGHVFVVNPVRREEFEKRLVAVCDMVKKELRGAYRITYPVRVYHWSIADRGLELGILSPSGTEDLLKELQEAYDMIVKMKTLP